MPSFAGNVLLFHIKLKRTNFQGILLPIQLVGDVQSTCQLVPSLAPGRRPLEGHRAFVAPTALAPQVAWS